jgi:hypothetical protein
MVLEPFFQSSYFLLHRVDFVETFRKRDDITVRPISTDYLELSCSAKTQEHIVRKNSCQSLDQIGQDPAEACVL